MHPRAFLLIALAVAVAACGDHPAGPTITDARTDPDGPDRPVDAAALPVDAAAIDAAVPPDDPTARFTLAVVPDTQYLFDQDRGDAEVLATSLRWIVDHARERRIAFAASLGDIVENAGPGELAAASEVYTILDRADFPYSVVAGNHDLRDQRPDDVRGPGEPYLVHFAPSRFAGQPELGGASDNGFNTFHIFTGGGRQWLVLALDWRVSAASIAWAQGVIDQHPTLPVIVTTHELAYDGGDGPSITGDAVLSGYGQYLWDQLIRRNDQIFLTINGHYWPSARAILRNDAGHDVHVHVTNYQNRYYGGSGMIRLYDVDLARGRIDVETFSPWVLGQPAAERSPLEQQELELVDGDNRFSLAIDFAARFAGFSPTPTPPVVPPEQVLIDGTLAYWRFDDGTPGQAVSADGVAIVDRSGHGNDLIRAGAGALTWNAAFDPRQPGQGTLYFDGAHLRTVDGAPLNAETFAAGYTIEAFLRLPVDCCTSRHAWMGILTRMGTGADVGRTADDPQEPLATMTVPPGGGLQWAAWPESAPGILTSWSHQLFAGPWIHVAIVNDGHRSVMYVDGAAVLRNPRAENLGILTTGAPWLLGAYQYGNQVEKSFQGWLGDVRIVARPLSPDQFLLAR